MNRAGSVSVNGENSSPSPEWKELFAIWKGHAFAPVVPLERLSSESHRLISIAGALCHAIVMGDVRKNDAPEAASLLRVAKWLETPATRLQRAWLEYQELCLSTARKARSEAEADLRTAEARLGAEAERVSLCTPDAVPPELVRAIESARGAADRAHKELPQLVRGIEIERDRALAPIDQELSDADASIKNLTNGLVAAEVQLRIAYQTHDDAMVGLFQEGPTNLLRPENTTAGSRKSVLLEQKRAAQAEIGRWNQEVVSLIIQIEQEQLRRKGLQDSRDNEERGFSKRRSQAVDRANQLKLELDRLMAEVGAHQDRAARRLALEVQSEAQAVDLAQSRVAELSRLLTPLDTASTRRWPKRESFVYLHLSAINPLPAHKSSFPSLLDSFQRCGDNKWTISGQACHKDALQAAFPDIVQSDCEEAETRGTSRWAVDANRVPEREREHVVSLLNAMCTVLCASTSLDAYFALDWYSTPDAATNQWHHTESGEMVNQAKYHGRRDPVATLAEKLAQFIRVHPLYSAAALVAAVPCLPSKHYDLPRHLCATLASLVKKIDITGALHKVRETKPMKDIDEHAEKYTNVASAFQADAMAVAGDDVILIDDTYGSGITMWEVARTLRSAGAKRVLGLTCAKNRGFR